MKMDVWTEYLRSTAAFFGRRGNISFCTAGTGSVEELPTAGFYSFVVEEI